MAGFANRNEGMISDSLTPLLQAPTVTQPQLQQAIPPQQVQTTDDEPRQKHKYRLYRLGISEVVFGCISAILGIATLILAALGPIDRWGYIFTWLSQGIWCGSFLIATGILGIKAKSNPSVCMYIANMTMSFVTAIAMIICTVLSVFAAGGEFDSYLNGQHSLAAFHIVLAIIGLAAAIVCVVHSVYCCAGVCCRRAPHGGHVTSTPQPHGVQQPHQMVRLANGQYILVPVYPGVSQDYTGMSNPMIAGQVVHQPPQDGTIVPSGQPLAVHPTAAYPPHGSQQPVQVNTSTNAPPQDPADVFYPTAITQVATDVSRNKAGQIFVN